MHARIERKGKTISRIVCTLSPEISSDRAFLRLFGKEFLAKEYITAQVTPSRNNRCLVITASGKVGPLVVDDTAPAPAADSRELRAFCQQNLYCSLSLENGFAGKRFHISFENPMASLETRRGLETLSRAKEALNKFLNRKK